MNAFEDQTDQPALPQFLGHPKGLFYLFFAELWERFSFYGMKALLVMYMTQQLLYTDQLSFAIFAAYGSLVYATPPIGGIIADKILGYRKAIIWGGILMAIGHFMLAIEHPVFFYGSLAFIIVGNGFFKPNISSFVGAIYQGSEEKKDAGFTIFYLGINLGGMLAPLLCAWLGVAYGWHYGFGLAGIGMLVGLFVFYKGLQTPVFGNKGISPDKQNDFVNLKVRENTTKVLSVLAVPLFALVIAYHEFESYLMTALLIGIVLMIIKIATEVSKAERQRLVTATYFTVLATLFWAIFEQAGSSITLFANRNVDLQWINASQTNSINSAYIILLCIPFSILWTVLSKLRKNPNTPIKFGIGLILLGIGFLTFSYSAQDANDLAKTPMFYLFIGYFIYTVGEMFISPIGLSKITELSPLKYASFMMGVWFLSSSYGHFFAGKIAQFTAAGSAEKMWFHTGWADQFIQTITSLSHSASQSMDVSFQQLYSYVSTYALVGLFSIVVGLIALFISPLIKKMMNGVH